MFLSAPKGQIADHPQFSISLCATATSRTSEKKQNQKGSPIQDKGVKVEDTSQQSDGVDCTAGKSDFLSDQPQPPTETMVSLTTACVVSAAAQNT